MMTHTVSMIMIEIGIIIMMKQRSQESLESKENCYATFQVAGCMWPYSLKITS